MAASTSSSTPGLILQGVHTSFYEYFGTTHMHYQVLRLAPSPFESSYRSIQDIFQDISLAARYNNTLPDPITYINVWSSNCATNYSAAVRGEGGRCKEICTDDTALFLPYNINTCLTLGAAAMMVNHKNVTQIQDPGLDEYERFDVGNLTTWDGTGIVKKIMECAADACSRGNLADCPQATQDASQTNATIENLSEILEGLSGFCDNAGLQVNSDIAGPGVMVSYLLQVSAALFFWLLLRILTSWPRFIAWPFYLLSQNSRARPNLPGFDPNLSPLPYDDKEPASPSRRRLAWTQANNMQNSLIDLRLHAATVSTLVEFQEVQTFFVGAIQVATLATFRPKGLSQSPAASSARSFGEAILDSQVVQALAIEGMLPVLLVQYLLQRYGMRWWYTFALVWAIFVMAMLVQARANKLISSFDTLWDVFVDSNSVPSCGGMANPMVYCDTDRSDFIQLQSGVIVIYLAMALLTIDFLHPIVRTWRPIKATLFYLSILEEQSRGYAWLRNKFWPRCLRFVWFDLECTLVFFIGVYFTDLLSVASDMNYGPNTWGPWSFGQLISVMVWAPLLFKFVYYNVFGIEEGFDHRLVKEYRVVRKRQRRNGDSDESGCSNMQLDDLSQDYEVSFRKDSSKSNSGKMRSGEVFTPDLYNSDTLAMTTPEGATFGTKGTWSRPLLRRSQS